MSTGALVFSVLDMWINRIKTKYQSAQRTQMKNTVGEDKICFWFSLPNAVSVRLLFICVF